MFWSGGALRHRRSGYPILAVFLFLLFFFHFGFVFFISRQSMFSAKTFSLRVAAGLGRSINAGGRSTSSQAIPIQNLMGDSSVLGRAHVSVFMSTTNCPLLRKIHRSMTAFGPNFRSGKCSNGISPVVNASIQWLLWTHIDEVGVSHTIRKPPLTLLRLSSALFKTISLHMIEGRNPCPRVREEQSLHRRVNLPLHSPGTPIVVFLASLPYLTVQSVVSFSPLDSNETFSFSIDYPELHNRRTLQLELRSFNRLSAHSSTAKAGLFSAPYRRSFKICHRSAGFAHVGRFISGLPVIGRRVQTWSLTAARGSVKELGKTLIYLTGLGLIITSADLKLLNFMGLKSFMSYKLSFLCFYIVIVSGPEVF